MSDTPPVEPPDGRPEGRPSRPGRPERPLVDVPSIDAEEGPLAEMTRAITALALELPPTVHRDVVDRWAQVLAVTKSLADMVRSRDEAARQLEVELWDERDRAEQGLPPAQRPNRDITGGQVPGEVFVGKSSGEWPLYVYENEVHAAAWLSQPGSGGFKQMWRCTLTAVEEVEFVAPSTPSLRAKGAEGGEA